MKNHLQIQARYRTKKIKIKPSTYIKQISIACACKHTQFSK